MNFKVILIAAAVLAAAHSQNLESPKRTRSFNINIREPITLIKAKLAAVFNNPNGKQAFIALFSDTLLDCILSAIFPSSSEDNQIDFHQIAREFEKLVIILEFNPPPLPFADTYNLSDYCETPGFKILHDFLIADDQWADLLKFFYNTGYPEVYSAFIDLYTVSNCPPELIAGLPTGPSPAVNSQPSTRSNLREEVLMSQSQLYQEQTCDIANITTQLRILGLVNWVDLFETVVTQVRTNPSLHFLVGKIQESNKGLSFREFRLLKPIQDIIAKVHENMVANPRWKIIFNFIKNKFGMDFEKANLVDTVGLIIEFILWGTAFPVPTPNSLA